MTKKFKFNVSNHWKVKIGIYERLGLKYVNEFTICLVEKVFGDI